MTNRTNHQRITRTHPIHNLRHSLPQRLRTRRGQLSHRRPIRSRSDPGHHQRHRRTYRQRRPLLHRTLPILPLWLQTNELQGQLGGNHLPLAIPRRDAQPYARSRSSLRRRIRLCSQGRTARRCIGTQSGFVPARGAGEGGE